MKAAVLTGAGTFAIADLPEPTAGTGEVVLQVSHCGICGSDLHFWDTGPFVDNMIMGHEFSGTIAAVGPGVDAWQVGQRVISGGGITCGTCVFCRQGDTQLCDDSKGLGTGGAPGAYAQLVAVPVETLIPIPDGVSFQQAATVEPLGNGLHCVSKSAFQPGDGALIVGSGPIGLSILVWLRRMGAGKIMVSEPAAGRRAQAERMGADLVVDPTAVDLRELLKDEFDGVGPPLVYECVGVPQTIQDALYQVRKGGEATIMGICFEPVSINPIAMVLRETRVRACLGTTKTEMERTLAAVADGSLKTDGFVTGEIALADVPATFERLHHPNTDVKVLIDHARH